MDISDGLVGDLAKLCRASGVSADIEIGRVPRSAAARRALVHKPALIETILTGGDDYEVLATMPYREAVDLARDRVSRDYLVALLRDTDGNVTRAAERAGMARESLHRLLKRLGVRSDDFKDR